ncbi:MAG: AAA family ATPase [Candidatus Micrarchaeia archaeon]
MLHVERLVIHNFKSFKHANIQFSQGFNCIAGPNGSGKSNICDALLFALGEQSLRRLRATNVTQLINDTRGNDKDKDMHPTYVKAVLGGDMPAEVLRTVRNNKIVYRLNGKRVTRQELVSFLNEKGSNINETNTITQGEIGKLLELNARERRELIDIAAGIKEFDVKKDAALKELDKVETKIGAAQMVLNERLGFMAELEKEKEQAEQYAKLSNMAKRLNYSLLTRRENEVLSAYSSAVKDYEAGKKSKESLAARMMEIDIGISDFSQKRDALSKKINESSIGASSTNRLLEQLNRDIAVRSSELGTIEKSVKELDERGRQLAADASGIEEKLKEDESSIRENEAKVSELERQVPAAQGEQVDDSEIVSSEYKASVEKLNTYARMISELSNKRALLNADIDRASKSVNQIKHEEEEADVKLKEYAELIDAKRKDLESSNSEKAKIIKEVQALQRDAEALIEERSKEDAEKLGVKEQLALSGNAYDRIEKALHDRIDAGFFGRVAGICSYEDKYALAVNAAAYSRLNYFVVDRIETAEKAIEELKRSKLGRASFIPIEDLKARKLLARKGLDSLISHIKYDKKFEKVVEYVFSNVYIVEEIRDAKQYGVGDARYVTLDGSLLDTSGIITGGSMRVQVSPAVLESKLRLISARTDEVNTKLKDIESKIEELKKELSLRESSAVKAETELKYLEESYSGSKAKREEAVRMREKASMEASGLEKSLALLDENLKKYEELESKEREASAALYRKLDAVFSSTGLHASKKEVAHIKEIRDQIEKLKIDIAAKRKEGEMLSQRLSEINAEIKANKDKSKKLVSEGRDASAEIAKLNGELEKLREKMKDYDESTRSTYQEVSKYEEQISKLSNEKGRISSELERVSRDLLEAEMKKAQSEVRLGDIRAELNTYGKYDPIDLPIEEIEKELARCKLDIEKLGTVNMKAPELYESRKKDVEEAQGHMKTLDAEKASIMDMIDQIESRKLNVFFETLDAVNKNFSKLYSHIFPGSAMLVLDKKDDPFNSGLSIRIDTGKKMIAPERYSGGQKSLVMLMLVFSIQMRNPMSFYIFDEIDSALDKENSKKLSLLIKELSSRSQFIVVTHNDSMIIAADTKIGISMQGGESKAVGIALASESDEAKGMSIKE